MKSKKLTRTRALLNCAVVTHNQQQQHNHLADAARRALAAEPTHLHQLREATAASDQLASGMHMLSGPVQGRLLHLLARMRGRTTRVLEIGTYTGYATTWFAAASADTTVLSLERDDRSLALAERAMANSGLSSRVTFRLGDAMESIKALPASEGPFDLVFIDADKRRYVDYYERILSAGLLAPDGLILSDNVLWKGQVVEHYARGAPSDEEFDGAAARRQAKLRDAMDAFNRHVAADARMQQLLLPFRDGLAIAQASSPDDAAALLDCATGAITDLTAPPEMRYLAEVGTPETALFARLRAEASVSRGYLVGAQLGRLLYMLVRLSKALPSCNVLEVGSAPVPYLSAWLAAAVPETGEVLALHADDASAARASQLLEPTGLASRLRCVVALDYLEEIARLQSSFELIVLRDSELTPAIAAHAARLLSPSGCLAILMPAGDDHHSRLERVYRDVSAASLTAAVVPSPDGDGWELALCGRASPWES